MATKPPALDPEQLGALRQALENLPGSERKELILEVYDKYNGEQRLSTVLDIRTGEPYRAKRSGPTPKESE